MEKDLVDRIWRRANGQCEYCQMLYTLSQLSFEIDHVIAKKHGGKNKASNLALSCFYWK